MTPDWSEIRRSEFGKLSPLFFNSAAMGPSPARARRHADVALEKELNPALQIYSEWFAVPDRLREKLGRLLGASPDSISHHAAVSELVHLLSMKFPFRDGDVVVSRVGEYPSDVLPWMMNEGRYRLQLLPSEAIYDLDLLKKEMPAKARILNVSHVAFDTGRRADLVALGSFCRERGILFVADCSQSFGGMPLTAAEIASVDILVGVTYKWLLGPYGHAFARFSDQALSLLPRGVGSWLASPNSGSVDNLTRYTAETLPGARRFDRGQAPNMLAMSVLAGGLELIEEIGLERIGTRNRQLVEAFLSRFPRDRFELAAPDSGSNIICLRKRQGTCHGTHDALRAQGVTASIREGNLRLSFHFFNQEEEVERLCELLSSAD